jgi:hypothetical protein
MRHSRYGGIIGRPDDRGSPVAGRNRDSLVVSRLLFYFLAAAISSHAVDFCLLALAIRRTFILSYTSFMPEEGVECALKSKSAWEDIWLAISSFPIARG